VILSGSRVSPRAPLTSFDITPGGGPPYETGEPETHRYESFFSDPRGIGAPKKRKLGTFAPEMSSKFIEEKEIFSRLLGIIRNAMISGFVLQGTGKAFLHAFRPDRK